MVRYRIKPILVLLALILVAAATSPAAADSETSIGNEPEDLPDVLIENDEVSLSMKDGWLRHDFREKLPGSSEVRRQGAAVVDPEGRKGCSYSGEETIAANEALRGKIHVSRQVGFNLGTCELVLEEALLSKAEAERFGFATSLDDAGPNHTVKEARVPGESGLSPVG